ncbi:hypothetical protein IX83_00245 [Basilea psittacipulmonis DSM 24701]|uniref:Uncharacterized protein n=1 Tax=Basilea psittacipulmonis DSM 24701 TaxID=1072685 RepID=A0A077DEW6_9BURK|nr:hypothetical protein IX83_00245 [Basilea psittacipulmonis DSM 24701]
MCKFNIEEKTGDWTKDIMLLSADVKWRIRELSDNNREVKELKNNNIYQNIYYKLIVDLVRFPRLYKQYIKKR